jgi:hypothetical protein
LWQDIIIVFLRSWRVPQGICEYHLVSTNIPGNVYFHPLATEYVCALVKTTAHQLNTYPRDFVAIFENYVAEIRLDGKAVQLALWDTAYVVFMRLQS